jgi:hypothetical protein
MDTYSLPQGSLGSTSRDCVSTSPRRPLRVCGKRPFFA